MVLIELDETEENSYNPRRASASTETPGNGKMESPDGFETASDGEIGDSGDENEEELNQKPRKEEQGQKFEKQETENLSQDEMMQKALAQANDAKMEGNKFFGQAKYDEALMQYEVALQTAPDIPSSVELRSICHANCGICFMKQGEMYIPESFYKVNADYVRSVSGVNQVLFEVFSLASYGIHDSFYHNAAKPFQGKYEETIKECTKALEHNPTYLKALIRRGEAHEKLEHFEEAIVDMKKILELDSSNEQAKRSIRRLEPLAEQKREKMKEEMIGKLKEMGNSLLGRFGMSLDNFKAVKDPNTGSYSVSYQQ